MALSSQDEKKVIAAAKIVLGGKLTESDLAVMSNRKEQLQVFDKMLDDPEFVTEKSREWETKDGEAAWQRFFQCNQWIFGYGLKLVSCKAWDETKPKLEIPSAGKSAFQDKGWRPDGLMVTRGLFSVLAFCEIKTPEKSLMDSKMYRDLAYVAGEELRGGVAQIQKTVGQALLDARKIS